MVKKSKKLNRAQKDVLASIHHIIYKLENVKLKRKDRKALREVIKNLSENLKYFS